MPAWVRIPNENSQIVEQTKNRISALRMYVGSCRDKNRLKEKSLIRGGVGWIIQCRDGGAIGQLSRWPIFSWPQHPRTSLSPKGVINESRINPSPAMPTGALQRGGWSWIPYHPVRLQDILSASVWVETGTLRSLPATLLFPSTRMLAHLQKENSIYIVYFWADWTWNFFFLENMRLTTHFEQTNESVCNIFFIILRYALLFRKRTPKADKTLVTFDAVYSRDYFLLFLFFNFYFDHFVLHSFRVVF